MPAPSKERNGHLTTLVRPLLLLGLLWSIGCSPEAGEAPNSECTFAVGRAGDDCNGGYGCALSDFCSTRNGTCIDGKLSASALSVLDCAYDPPKSPVLEPRSGNLWSDCEAALADGQTGEPCSTDGNSWACAKHTTDGCCEDIAICEATHSLTPTLIMATTCAIDCSSNAVDTSRSVASDCLEAFAARPNDPCSGDFSCADYSALVLDIRWCDKGTLRVNQQGILPAIMFGIDMP